jgi:hypothetical protein
VTIQAKTFNQPSGLNQPAEIQAEGDEILGVKIPQHLYQDPRVDQVRSADPGTCSHLRDSVILKCRYHAYLDHLLQILAAERQKMIIIEVGLWR